MNRRIVLIAALAALGLLLTILVFIPRPSIPAITVRHINSVQVGDWVAATFEITNPITRRYYVDPVSVEVRNGLVWRRCFECISHPRPITVGHGSQIWMLEMTNLPTGFPLRLRMVVAKELPGLEGAFERFKHRVLGGSKGVSLNPFDRASSVFSKQTAIEIVSGEFIEPDSNHTEK